MNASARDQFSNDWLSLREPADHHARAQELLPPLNEWLSARPNHPFQVVDFGSGRGSNLHYLAPKLVGMQGWTLLDHDGSLLAQAQQRGQPGGVARLQVESVDLRHANTWQPLCVGVDLMTASALIDIVSADWLQHWVNWGVAQGSAFLVALSVDGRWRCAPEHPDDVWVQALFNAHQQAQGAFGLSLGPSAVDVMATQLRAQHYQVTLAASPWQLEPAQQALQTQLLSGWAQAAIEQSPADQSRVEQWQQRRQHWIASGESTLMVGHYDLLALPR